jgi:hypothetical protein
MEVAASRFTSSMVTVAGFSESDVAASGCELQPKKVNKLAVKIPKNARVIKMVSLESSQARPIVGP